MLREDGENSDFWKNRRVLVAGGAGFIGGHLVHHLLDLGSEVTIADNLENDSGSRIGNTRADFLKSDLADEKFCQVACKDAEVVYNAAAKVAGVGYNTVHPGEMFHRNALINLNMLEAARKSDVDSLVVFSSACGTKRDVGVRTIELAGLCGDPGLTTLGYGVVRRPA